MGWSSRNSVFGVRVYIGFRFQYGLGWLRVWGLKFGVEGVGVGCRL